MLSVSVPSLWLWNIMEHINSLPPFKASVVSRNTLDSLDMNMSTLDKLRKSTQKV